MKDNCIYERIFMIEDVYFLFRVKEDTNLQSPFQFTVYASRKKPLDFDNIWAWIDLAYNFYVSITYPKDDMFFPQRIYDSTSMDGLGRFYSNLLDEKNRVVKKRWNFLVKPFIYIGGMFSGANSEDKGVGRVFLKNIFEVSDRLLSGVNVSQAVLLMDACYRSEIDINTLSHKRASIKNTNKLLGYYENCGFEKIKGFINVKETRQVYMIKYRNNT